MTQDGRNQQMVLGSWIVLFEADLPVRFFLVSTARAMGFREVSSLPGQASSCGMLFIQISLKTYISTTYQCPWCNTFNKTSTNYNQSHLLVALLFFILCFFFLFFLPIPSFHPRTRSTSQLAGSRTQKRQAKRNDREEQWHSLAAEERRRFGRFGASVIWSWWLKSPPV